MKKLGLVLLSGGLDSTTVAARALRQGYRLGAVTLQYGQTHRREIAAARAVADRLGIRHRVVAADFFRDLAWYSSLTSPDRFATPTGRAPQDMATEVPITYVPLRNTFFLTLGAAMLESEALPAIEQEGADPGAIEATL